MAELLSNAKRPDEITALALMEEALQILDDVDAPGEIGAYVDLAICRMRELVVGKLDASGGADSNPR